MHIIVRMLIKLIRIFCFIFNLIKIYLFTFHRETIITKERSKYNKLIIISKCGSKRLMRFNSLSNGSQSQIDLNRIDYPCVEYIQLMIISLIYYPYILNEKNILIIGLGGGTLPRAIRKLYPMSFITIIEIDSIVNEIAKKYFYFKEDSRMKVYITDGRKFLENLSNIINYDIIYLDAYDSISGLPSHMKTQEFFIQLKNFLNINGGLLILNLVCIYQSFKNVYQTIQSVFGQTNLLTFRSTDFFNIILIASSSIEYFPTINYQSNIIDHIQQNLSINVNNLLKKQQKKISNQNLSLDIYKDNTTNIYQNEQDISLLEFIDIV